jgi:2'-5' RNA ligase
MSGAARYAIYYAPPADSPLWAFGSHVLGYDAATGGELHGFAPPGLGAADWRALTERPRTYGFHATLKAPFALGEGDETDLQEALASFAAGRAPVRLGSMAIRPLMEPGAPGFAALVPMAPPPALAALERDIVTEFDRFRRALTAEERERRRPDRLSERQRLQLDAYGYPFVFEDFRFHMTLSGATSRAAELADGLAGAMAAAVGLVDLTLDALCLFRQAGPQERFRIVGRHALGGRA